MLIKDDNAIKDNNNDDITLQKLPLLRKDINWLCTNGSFDRIQIHHKIGGEKQEQYKLLFQIDKKEDGKWQEKRYTWKPSLSRIKTSEEEINF
jgi:hypothetical protein